jgi:hydroxymethylpyrimidine/phosphomethylpyrimidine kinase
VQNTLGVTAVFPLPPALVAAQMVAVLDDIGADALKSGMLANEGIIEAIAGVLCVRPRLPYVLDPVLLAKGGTALLAPDAVHVLREKLFPLAIVITPNLPEAEFLLGCRIDGIDAMVRAARQLQALSGAAILLKGGHMAGDVLTDVLVEGDEVSCFDATRLAVPHTHGTGCTLASSVASGLAQGLMLKPAVMRARAYVRAAIESAPGLGAGAGPLNHLVDFRDGKKCGIDTG